MPFFKHTTSSQNCGQDTEEDLDQNISSQKLTPELSMSTHNFPGMAKSLMKQLFRQPRRSVSPLITLQEASKSIDDANRKDHAQVRRTGTEQDFKSPRRTRGATSQIIKDITVRSETALKRAQMLLKRAREQEKLAKKKIEERRAQPALSVKAEMEESRSSESSQAREWAETGDNLNRRSIQAGAAESSQLFHQDIIDDPKSVVTPNVKTQKPSLSHPPSTPTTHQGLGKDRRSHLTDLCQTPPSPSLFRRVCDSIQKISQNLVLSTLTSAAQAHTSTNDTGVKAGDENPNELTSNAHRKSVLFAGPDKLESITPTRACQSSSSVSSPEKPELTATNDQGRVEADGESVLFTPQPTPPEQPAVRQSRSSHTSHSSRSPPKSNTKVGGKRTRVDSASHNPNQKEEPESKRSSSSRSPAKKQKLTLPSTPEPLSNTSLASGASSRSSQGSTLLKRQHHLDMVEFIQTNSIKKCLLNFTKADLITFLRSEGVAHVSEELSKKQLLDEARALVSK